MSEVVDWWTVAAAQVQNESPMEMMTRTAGWASHRPTCAQLLQLLASSIYMAECCPVKRSCYLLPVPGTCDNLRPIYNHYKFGFYSKLWKIISETLLLISNTQKIT